MGFLDEKFQSQVSVPKEYAYHFVFRMVRWNADEQHVSISGLLTTLSESTTAAKHAFVDPVLRNL